MVKDKIVYPSVNKEIVREHGLSDDEYNQILNILKREPNFVELGIFLPKL